MKLAFNALNASSGAGISSLINLLPALANVDKENIYFVFISEGQKEILGSVPDKFKIICINYLPNNSYVRVLWEQFILPFYILYYKIDILYSTANTTSLCAPCKIVLVMENSIPYSANIKHWTMKERIRNILVKYLGYLSAKRAERIRFVSHQSKQMIAARLKIPDYKCSVIYHGFNNNAESDIEHKNSFYINKEYILTVSVVAPHKNIEHLIKAFDVLISKYNYKGNLMVIGDLCYENYYKHLTSYISKLNLEGRIFFINHVPHKLIKAYYINADAFVMPSIAETFCMPLVEAMGFGVPSATSDIFAFPKDKKYFIPFREICGDAVQYFNPFDPNDIAFSINKIIIDEEYRKMLVEKGKIKSKQYNWDDTAEFVVKLFRETIRS